MHAPAPRKPCLTLFNPTSILVIREQASLFTLFNLFLYDEVVNMGEGQIKSKGPKIAPGGHCFTSEFDSHHYYWSCRDKKKGDVCVTSKEEDCYICIQFSYEQNKKNEL